LVSSKDYFDFAQEPLRNFKELYDLAFKSGVPDPTAMALSSVGLNNKPSSRIVLLKDFEDEGFVFYTNYNSSKSQDITRNPNVELLFYWQELYVQVRVSGVAKKSARESSEKYFATRPRTSQLGAWASQQSEIIEGYEVLEKSMNLYYDKFRDQVIPCPPHWGGFTVEPSVFEFWFGMEGRLHFRYIYEKNGTNWIRAMKSP
jgi:pyridoxamine 5'-phosphate oxidase